MHALAKWRVYLEGRQFIVYSDHATLQHFPDQPKLSHHQAHWTEKMQEYDFTIKYLPGKQNVVADAMSCHPDLQLNTVFYVEAGKSVAKEIKESLTQDPDFQPILESLNGVLPTIPVPASLLKHYSLNDDGMLVYDHS